MRAAIGHEVAAIGAVDRLDEAERAAVAHADPGAGDLRAVQHGTRQPGQAEHVQERHEAADQHHADRADDGAHAATCRRRSAPACRPPAPPPPRSAASGSRVIAASHHQSACLVRTKRSRPSSEITVSVTCSECSSPAKARPTRLKASVRRRGDRRQLKGGEAIDLQTDLLGDRVHQHGGRQRRGEADQQCGELPERQEGQHRQQEGVDDRRRRARPAHPG